MEKYESILLGNIAPDPRQPRRYFDPEKLNDLAESIKINGLLQPIKVRPNPNQGDPEFMIISGERRWRASKIAEQETIPSVVVSDQISQAKLYAQQLAENIDREELTPVEKAEALQLRIDEIKGEGVDNALEQVSKEVGKSLSWVSKNTKILKYSPEVRELVHQGKIKDYTLLKKLDALKGEKRENAINLIQSGEFNGKEFFSRKRYDKKKPTESDEISQAKDDPAVKAKSTETKNKFKLELTPQGVVTLIDKTEYASVLDKSDPKWRDAIPQILKVYFDQFTKWLLETE